MKAVLDVFPFVGKVWVLSNEASTPLMPYLLIEPGIEFPSVEDSLAFDDGDQDIRVRVKAVSTNVTSTHIGLRHAKTMLTGGRRLGSLNVPGRVVTVEYLRHEADYEDNIVLQSATQVTLSVDSYRLVSQLA